MEQKTYIGIDNGITGSIGVLGKERIFALTPIKQEQDYTKKHQRISRLDTSEMLYMMFSYTTGSQHVLVLLERPLVNPSKFRATVSAVRCLEATLTVLEALSIPYEYLDSRQWQREMLPKGIKGSTELKRASRDIGIRLFPEFSEEIEAHGDADGLLMAEWARRNGR